ncbi:MAG TPA: adenylate/guanylate cyclase domain-containing protein, partial [Cryptosporangiaceae bacterium]|nr:adenylate/guanylate cyclase domain-containing protein [Cryptosporangiaceae bacterium]
MPCQAVGRPGDRFCGRCGAPLATRCEACGQVPVPGSAACDLCGAILDPEARPGGSREERRLVTILFADLVGFTGLGERLDPEDLRSVQQTYFDLASRVIRRRHGVVEKYIGDAVMAVFGAPVSQEDDAVRAVRAGLELQAALDRQVEGRDGPMRLRVGIATGEVVVDLDAVRDRGQALVAGDVVNIAARLQQHAPPGGVLVSAATWRMTLDHVEYTETEPITVKGKTASLAVWQAERMVQRRWDDHPDRGPFVGREPELERLTEALRITIDRAEPRLVCLVGAPGIGKSRLVREFNRHADHTLAVAARWMGGRCLPGEGGVFAALADVIAAHADLHESDPADVARRKLQASLHGLFTGAEQARMVEALAPLVGVDAARVGAEESGSAWRLFFQRLADQRPLVLVIEDLHCAEPPLLEFLDALVSPGPRCPLLVVGTLRPEFEDGRSPWPGEGPDRTVIPLAPLGEHHTGTLFRSLAGDQTIPEPVLRKLAGLAGGTPLYAHEYVRMLADTGALAEADKDLDDGVLPLPDSVHAVVAGRIDLLDRVTQRALQAAAVVGEVFWPGAVEAVAELPRNQVTVVLAELRRREFLRAAADGGLADQPALRFDHAVVRDAVYRRQPRALRLMRH